MKVSRRKGIPRKYTKKSELDESDIKANNIIKFFNEAGLTYKEIDIMAANASI